MSFISRLPDMPENIMGTLRAARDIFTLSYPRFLYIQRIKGFDVLDLPLFDNNDSVVFFHDMLKSATLYLEYGSGGSTCLAAKLRKRFVTVDSDPYFLNAVKKKIKSAGLYDESTQKYLYADIGPTGSFGKPLMANWSGKKRKALFSNYQNKPWDICGRDFAPDLILIDGRFRVACALKTILMLSGRRDWTMIVDDYKGRPHYRAIEKFAVLQKQVGRLAVFGPPQSLDKQHLLQEIASYENDAR